MREARVESRLVEGVKALGGWAVKVYPVSQAGLPDRIVFLPGGRTFLVELKRPKGGVLSPVQKVVHARLGRMGHEVATLWSTEEVDSWLRHVGSTSADGPS